jgi:hypothetical protein
MAAFPLTGPHRASGHASNVFRRSAAHNFGKHATPAVISRKTVAASSSPTPIREGWTSAPRHQGDPGRNATVEPTEPTVKKSVPRFRLTRDDGQSRRRADWTPLRFERNLCFFLKAAQCRRLRRETKRTE